MEAIIEAASNLYITIVALQIFDDKIDTFSVLIFGNSFIYYVRNNFFIVKAVVKAF